jgi:hypothetical protein
MGFSLGPLWCCRKKRVNHAKVTCTSIYVNLLIRSLLHWNYGLTVWFCVVQYVVYEMFFCSYVRIWQVHILGHTDNVSGGPCKVIWAMVCRPKKPWGTWMEVSNQDSGVPWKSLHRCGYGSILCRYQNHHEEWWKDTILGCPWLNALRPRDIVVLVFMILY